MLLYGQAGIGADRIVSDTAEEPTLQVNEMRKRLWTEQGVTLIELMIVGVIIGLSNF